MENKKKSSILKRMNPYIVGFKLPFVIASMGAIISSIITVYGPTVLKNITEKITDGLQGNLDMTEIGRLATMLAILYGIGALIGYGQSFIVGTIVQRFSQLLRAGISQKINRLPLNYFDSHSQGDTLSRVTNDVDTTAQSLNQSLGTIVTAVMLLIGSVFMMFVTSVTMAWTAIGSVLIGFVISMVIMISSQKFFKAQQANLAAISGFVEETYTGHHVVTNYNAVEESKIAFENLNGNLYNSMWKSQFISGIMMPLMIFVGNFGYVMVCVVGAILTLNGDARLKL